MYKELPLEALVPHAQNANRISRMFARKLRHNIEQIGIYETLTVRPHPYIKGKFEILNGHARLEVLHGLGVQSVKCDIWKINDLQTRLFLAILNRLRGSDVAELRMNLLFNLLQDYPKEELAKHIPETVSYLAKLEKLPEETGTSGADEQSETPDVVIVNFYLTSEQQRVINRALEDIAERFSLSDSGHALTKLATLYIEQSQT